MTTPTESCVVHVRDVPPVSTSRKEVGLRSQVMQDGGETPTTEQRREEECHELGVEFAKRHLEHDESIRDIAAQYYNEVDGPSKQQERHVRDLIRRARPTLRIRVEKVQTEPAIERSLSNDLEAAAGLRKAIILAADGDEAGSSDSLHYKLGWLAADFLRETLRHRDAVAVGAGRGVAYSVRALREMLRSRPVEVQELKVFSAVGAMWVRTESLQIPGREFVDADQSAVELAHAFNVPWERVHLVSLPRLFVVPGDSGDGAELVSRKEETMANVAPHLLGDHWGEDAVDSNIAITLFGLGVVNHPGHYMTVDWGPQSAALPEIRTLKETVLPVAPDSIIDVCDRFWLCEEGLNGEILSAARHIVDQLNRRSVTLSFNKLNSAQFRCLVAGGAQKIKGMVEVLTNGERIGVQPNVVVTDEATARAVLRSLDAE